MDIEKILKAEHLAYRGEDGESNIYILPDAEAVEQLLTRLRDGGVSDTIQVSLAQRRSGQESTMGGVEQLLDDYLAVDGEQKVYVLPDELNVEQILGNFVGLRTGEIKQSQMWRKTDVTIDAREQIAEMSARFQAMDKRIEQLEILLNQVGKQEGNSTDQKLK